jgi:hypothetical protein
MQRIVSKKTEIQDFIWRLQPIDGILLQALGYHFYQADTEITYQDVLPMLLEYQILIEAFGGSERRC